MIERLVRKYAYRKNCIFAKQILDDVEKMDFLRRSWPKYKNCAEVDLKSSFMDFYAEMSTFLYLSKNAEQNIKSFRLSDSGFQRNEGPDLYASDMKAWFECISPSKITSYDRALRIFKNGVDRADFSLDLVDQKFYNTNGLRFLNPLLSKYKKYKKYIDSGVVSDGDTKIISISLQKMGYEFDVNTLSLEFNNLLSLLRLDAINGVLLIFGEISKDKYLYIENNYLTRMH